MNHLPRRDFLKLATGASLALLATAAAPTLKAADQTPAPHKYRGVNLGGWLVLERWITPTLYRGIDAEDEYTLCQKLGAREAASHLGKHRETWIVAEDFKWLADHGINSVRLPVGYGVLENNTPFVSGRETMDFAFKCAQANNIKVLLDLHGVPGSQNGWDHSGRSGPLGWHVSPDNINHSLRIIEGLAEYCSQYDNLMGIELLNEPRKEVPMEILRKYYSDAYKLVRTHISPERGAVVFHDGFRARDWGDFMQTAEWQNVYLDTHLYQCFSDEDKQRKIQEQLEVAGTGRTDELQELRKTHKCIVGEWSCSLPRGSLRGLKGFDFNAALRAYGSTQLLSYESCDGWFFWTYRTETAEEWNFRVCTERGWLPDKFNT